MKLTQRILGGVIFAAGLALNAGQLGDWLRYSTS